MKQAFIVSTECPMPCTEVVFAKSLETERVFAVCTSCGCAWFEPQHEQWEIGDLGNCVIDPTEYAPRGFVLATQEEIKQAGFETLVVDVQDGEEWEKEFAWYSKKYCRRHL